ncbi:MAG: hypothetical protein QOE75_163 [Solirubrobacterales bacterium]|jgi:Flp pilus assembly pilin Flp|nr:hypothetical protein [Solirubrobacterales bacterium]
MSTQRLIKDERGATLIELVVGMFAGLVVMAALITLIMVTIGTTSRVSARVHATQEARLTLNKVIDQLHSACIAPKIPPIREGSSATELRFVHATGSAVSPTPTETRITYANGELTQRDYSWVKGVAPLWEFQTTPSRTVLLNDGIGPIGNKPVFTYYRSSGGTPAQLEAPLTGAEPNETIHVTVAFSATPNDDNGEDATPARIQGSATLRLTGILYSTTAPSYPCQ